MNKLLRLVVFLGALALICATMVVLGLRSARRAALRRYIAELQAKGEKLTFAELTRGWLTNQTDTHSVFTHAADTLSGKKLGPDPGLLELRAYVRPGQATVVWRQPKPLWAKSKGPVDNRGWAELDAQLQAAQNVLQRMRDALHSPAPNAGPGTNMFLEMFGYWRTKLDAVRTARQWLAAAAENDLRRGRLEEALQNLEALAGLANLYRDEPSLNAQMLRVRTAMLGLAATWEALQAPGWTEPQLERMQNTWAPLDLVEVVEKGFVGERACGYEMFGLARRYGGAHLERVIAGGNSRPASTRDALLYAVGNYTYLPAYKLIWIDEDELFYLRNLQEGITSLRLLNTHHPWAEAKPRLDQVATNFTAASSSDHFRHCLSTFVIPQYSRVAETAVHAETERQMALAAIALKRFQLRHGALPPSLAALVPELLPAVPYDYLSAKPLLYRLQADGSYVLYSVGDDGKDDGGDPTPRGPANDPWSGRDVVWPSATGP